MLNIASESFPRMWDQPVHWSFFHPLNRIIPTYVGSTELLLIDATVVPNHSHVCGINLQMFMRPSSISESFPRMWDQHRASVPFPPHYRIIPTYVGSTDCALCLLSSAANHSHVCGINTLSVFYFVLNFESFPRMWDQPPSAAYTARRLRIIPTYVGSTRRPVNFSSRITNHSHVCGINFPVTVVLRFPNESFPRMWDQLQRNSTRSSERRIIPTYVGSTSS